jgi:hypothetical protein
MFKHPFGYCLAVGIMAASPALAISCADRDRVVERLQTKFSESLTVGGLQKTQNALSVMEIWASYETGTYTVLLTNPNGITCIVAAGTDFFEATPKRSPHGTAG